MKPLEFHKNYKALILIILLVTNVKSFNIKNLSPGVHVYSLGSCEVKATELILTVNTTLSINDDIKLIDKHVREFPEICNIKHPELQKYCMDWYKKLTEEATLTKNKILTECTTQKSRSKRAVYNAVFSAAGKLWQVASRYSGPILGASVAYQGYKIYDLGNKLDSKETSIKHTLKLMMNATDHEMQNHEQFLNDLVEVGNNGSYRERITSFAASNIEVFNLIKQRYENVFTLKPTKVLMDQMKSNNNELHGLRLPNLNNIEDIFEKSDKVKFCTNDTIMLEFQIPLVQSNIFYKYSIISVPTETRDIIVVNNNADLVTNIVVDVKNETFVDADHAIPMFDNIYDYKAFEVSSKCLKEVLSQSNPIDCLLRTGVDRMDKIYSINDSHSIIFNEESQTVIECPNKTIKSNLSAAIVEHAGCGIKTANLEVLPKQHMTMNINYSSLSDLETDVPEIIYSKIKLDDELRQKLRKEIEDSFNFNQIVGNNFFSTSFMAVLIILGIIGIYLLWSKFGAKKQKQNAVDVNINVGSAVKEPTPMYPDLNTFYNH